MELFSIGEVAQRTGLPPSTLRYYEQVGLLPPPPRHNGRRRYGREVLPHIRLIQAGRAAGLTIADLKKLVADQSLAGPVSAPTRLLLSEKIERIQETINQLQNWQETLKQWRSCGCDPVEKCELLSTLSQNG